LRALPLTPANVAQTVTTVLVAIAFGAGTLVAATASDKWDQSQDVVRHRADALLADLHQIYVDEASQALDLAMAKARVQLLTPGDERDVDTFIWAALQSDADEATDLRARRYRVGDIGYDGPRRLADVRRAHHQLTPDPVALRRDGDQRGHLGLAIAALSIPLVLAYVAVDLVLLRRRRKQLRDALLAEETVGLVPVPWGAPFSKRAALVVGMSAWLVVTLGPTAQIWMSTSEDRARALAASTISDFQTRSEASAARVAFRRTADNVAVDLRLQSLGAQERSAFYDILHNTHTPREPWWFAPATTRH
jgi:hypothetical protein